ncbi:MAG: lasso peptide biosynthesis protein [Anaerolineae bacterium]|nr:lasso peptide biosynthesis protein [Anaerolineae bacterium]
MQHLVQTTTLLSLATLLLAGCAWSGLEQPTPEPLAGGEERWYAIRIGEQTMGYGLYRIVESAADTVHTESQTLLKLDIAGQTHEIRYAATATLSASLRPRDYALTLNDGGDETQIRLTIAQETAHLVAIGSSGTTETDLPFTGTTWLLDGNLFDHYVYLVRGLQPRAGATYDLKALIPQAGAVLEMTLKVAPDLERVDLGGQAYRCLRMDMSGPDLPAMTLWATTQGELVRVTVPSQNAQIELAGPEVVGEVTAINLFALLAGKFAPSNVAFSSFANVAQMTARVEIESTGAPFSADELNNGRQSFEGSVTGQRIAGTFRTQIVRYDGVGAPPFPMDAPASLAGYLSAEPKIEAGDPEIVALAQELTAGQPDAWQAAVAVADWVYRNIAYQITGAGARQCLADRQGDCGPKSYLTIALLRAAGIPARMVGGVMYASGQFGQHYWVEAWMGEAAGWVPLEPTVGQFGWLDATHLRLWESAGVASLEIEVLDYTDTGAGTADLETRAVALAAGESGRYVFRQGETKFGDASYRVVACEAGLCRVQQQLALDAGKVGASAPAVTISATLTVDADLHPRRYALDAMVGDDRQTIDLDVTDGVAHTSVVARGQTYEQDVALQPGTYLLGSNLLGWHALMLRGLDLAPGKTFQVPVFFPERFAAMTVQLAVRDATETITVGGQSYECLVMDIADFQGEVDYVTLDGRLIRVALPSQNVTIDVAP